MCICICDLSIYIYVLYLYILIQLSMYVKKAAFCSIFNKSRCRLDKGTDSPQGSPVGLSSSWWSSWSSLRRHFHAPDFAQAGKCNFACVWNQKQLPILSYCHKYISIYCIILYICMYRFYIWWMNGNDESIPLVSIVPTMTWHCIAIVQTATLMCHHNSCPPLEPQWYTGRSTRWPGRMTMESRLSVDRIAGWKIGCPNSKQKKRCNKIS